MTGYATNSPWPKASKIRTTDQRFHALKLMFFDELFATNLIVFLLCITVKMTKNFIAL